MWDGDTAGAGKWETHAQDVKLGDKRGDVRDKRKQC